MANLSWSGSSIDFIVGTEPGAGCHAWSLHSRSSQLSGKDPSSHTTINRDEGTQGDVDKAKGRS